jgi:hypothetical protein
MVDEGVFLGNGCMYELRAFLNVNWLEKICGM